MMPFFALSLALAFPAFAAESGAGKGNSPTAPASPNSQASDYSDLEGRPLMDILHAESTASKADRVRIKSFLREKGTPQTNEDLKFVESEITQEDESRSRRALAWLSNTHNQELVPELLRFFEERRAAFPSSHVAELAKHPEKNAAEAQTQEILGAIMLKLADLNARTIIPRLREYANAEDGGNIHTNIGAVAYQALARIKDEEFFGVDRRARLAHRHVDFSDPKTKPWLMETMVNDQDWNIRLLAGEAWAQTAADPENPSDLTFAWTLIDNPGSNLTRDEKAYRRARGFDVLLGAVAKGHFDQKIFDKAREEAQRNDKSDKSNKVEAAQLLAALGQNAKFRDQSLDILRRLLTGPDISARGLAQDAIGRLTGKRPHFDGEISCDEHPLRFAPVKAAPTGVK